MRRTANGRCIYALADYSVERSGRVILRSLVALRRHARDDLRWPERKSTQVMSENCPLSTNNKFKVEGGE